MVYGNKINRKVDMNRKSTMNYSKLKGCNLSDEKYSYLQKKKAMKIASKMAKFHAFRKYCNNDIEF